MIRISALNDSSDDESQSLSKSRQTTKEAQETAALALYNRALTLLRQGDEDGAKDTFCELLEAPFVRDAEAPEGNEVLVEPGLVLKYSTYKNLGSMSAQREDYLTAMKYYLEAVMVDSSDVTVWYKIGSIALNLHHYPLARHAFEQGLECQPRHWPCIDKVITVLYALNNYEACLVYISRALQRDPGYVKGVCFMEKIFDEQPTLRQHMVCHFANCDPSIFTVEVDQEEADEFIDEALDMRTKKEVLCRRRERPVLKFTQPFTALTWMNLTSCLISLYDHIVSSKPPITYSCKVDLSTYMSKEAVKPPPTPQVTATLPIKQSSDQQASDQQPSEKQSSEQQQSEKQCSDQQPSEKQASEQQPSEKQSSEQQPSEKQCSDQQPSEKQSSEQHPSEKQSLDQQPSEKQSSDQQSSEKQPSDQQPSDKQCSDQQSSDQQPSEKRSLDQQPSEKQSSDQQSSDPQPSDQQSTKEPSSDQQPSEITSTVETSAKPTPTAESSSTETVTRDNAVCEEPSDKALPTEESGCKDAPDAESSGEVTTTPATKDEPMDTTGAEPVVPDQAPTDTKVQKAETAAVQSTSEVVSSEVEMAEVPACDEPTVASDVRDPEPSEAEMTEKEEQQDVNDTSTFADANNQAGSSTSVLEASTSREPAKRGPKKKRFAADIEKRRSTRVRNTGTGSSKQMEDDVKIKELVVSLLPTSLTEVREEDQEAESSQEAAMDTGSQEEAASGSASGEALIDMPDIPSLKATEEDDVLHYMLTHQNNSGIIDLLNELLIALAQRALSVWPDGLTAAFVKAYSRLHKHIIMPGYLCKDVPDERIRNMGKMILLHGELKVDRWIASRSRSLTSPRRSGTNSFGFQFAGTSFYSDLAYLDGVSQCQDIFAEDWADFNIRVFWMKAKFSMLDCDMEEALCSFELTNSYLEYVEKEKKTAASLFLPHLHHDNKVTQENVKKQTESLQRCQSQDKMQDLHDSGEYEKVIQLLLETFNVSPGPRVLEIDQQERHSQLLLLMESLLKIKDYKRGIIWGEVSFNQALQKYYSATTDSTRDEWVTAMIQILDAIDKCIVEDNTVISNLTSKYLVRLTQNVTSLIEMAFDVPENASDMAISTMLPWILLYKLVRHEEDRNLPTPGEDESFTFAHCGSINLLELVHEQLGRRAWCCNQDGSLLLFIVSEVLGEIKAAEEAGTEHPQQKMFDLVLEQCFYCLYGHPNRKKAKHLQDHSSSQISLTWERAVHVFEFFKPKTMPEYDSLKTSTVSAELESLLRRIYIMIPDNLKLPTTVDEITAYIEGSSDTPPIMSEGADNDLLGMSELYYLLADFYFKNKEQGKAIKFYMQDLCVNPLRFDSWAGMALARASRLEQKLGMSELKSSEGKNEGSIWKYAVASLRSFQRALDVDSTNSVLWIEYGSLAYQLHAHASRQLKQQTMYPLPDQSIEEAKTNREEMLNIAEKCYRKAGECEVDENEEEWLHHYMLGKVAEKKGSDPVEYLKHYKLALHHLHNDRARYPRKITYIYSPPHMAVEALEVFYRLHASIMKYLLQHPEGAPYTLFDTYTQEAADGPFANAREKRKEPKESEINADDSSNSNSTAPVTSMVGPTSISSAPTASTTGKKKCHSTRMDHTYSKQRSMDSARSDADSSSENAKDGSNETAKDSTEVHYKGTAMVTIIDSMDSMQSAVSIVAPVQSASAPSAPLTAQSGEGKFVTPVPVASTSTHKVEEDKSKTPMNTLFTSSTTEEFFTPMATSFSIATSDEDVFSTPAAVSVLESDATPKPSTLTEESVVVSSEVVQEDLFETISPNTTCVDESDVLMELEGSVSIDTSEGDPQPSTSAGILSPNTSQSVSQESLPLKDAIPTVHEDMEVSVDYSELAPEGDKKDTTIEDTAEVKVKKECTEIGEHSSTTYYEQDTSVKIEAEATSAIKDEPGETAVPTDALNVGIGHTATDSSSQDSTTAAELERLKSEISFLNAGSLEMTSAMYIDISDQESINDEKDMEEFPTSHEMKVEAEDQNKEDEEREMTTRNDALEALKSELQELSAAAGTTSYDDQAIKVEADSPEQSSQGFPLAGVEADTEVPCKCPEKSPTETSEDIQEDEKKVEIIGHIINLGDAVGKSAAVPVEEPIGEKENVAEKNLDLEKEKDQSANPEDKTSRVLPNNQALQAEPDAVTDGSVSVNKDNALDKETEQDKSVKDMEVTEVPTVKEEAKEPSSSKDNKDASESSSQEIMDTEKDSVRHKELGKKAATAKCTPEETQTMKEVASVDEAESDKDKTVAKKTDETDVDSKKMFKKIMTRCMNALSLCLARFPHHYKSLYRLAYVYHFCEEFKNLTYARDMLLGNMNWSHLEHMSCPGLFQERKSTNFFQGLWRIPVEEIDRSGSFACHMLRSLQLLFPTLMGLKDSKMLFSIHLMLSRTPDQGRKYLRDSDRLELSRLALVYSTEILDSLVKEKSEIKEREPRITFMLDIFTLWQHCVGKANQLSHSHLINKLLRRAFFTCMKEEIEEKPSVLEQAIRFCQHEHQHAVKSPTTPEPGMRSSLPSTPTTKRGNPFEFVQPSKTGASQADSSKTDVAGSRPPVLKGITPLPGRGNFPTNPKSLSQMVKPCSVRLTSPGRPKLSLPGSGAQRSSPLMSQAQKLYKNQDQMKKLTMSNVLQKPDIKKPAAGSSTSMSTTSSTSSSSTQKTQKKSTPTAPYSIFQQGGGAGLNPSQAAALYAQMAHMSPEMYAQYSEVMMQQAALASYGIPLAAMPYMYSGGGIDPTLWSTLAAAQAFQETQQSPSQLTPPPRQSSTVKGASTVTTASSGSSQQQKSSHKAQSSARTSSALEPPKKMAKMTPVAWRQHPTTSTVTTSAVTSSASNREQASALTKHNKPLSLTTSTTVSASTSSNIQSRHDPPAAHTKVQTKPINQPKTPPGLKLSAKTSQLYAVRMSSALAKLSQKTVHSPGSVPQQRLDAPSPAKVARKVEASSTSTTASTFDPLDMLATAAQTHKISSPVTPKSSSVKPDYRKSPASQQRPQAPVAPPPRSIKGPPTLKRAGKYGKQHIRPTPHAQSSHRSPTAAQPINLSSHQPTKGAALHSKGTALPKAQQAGGGSLLAHHLISTGQATATPKANPTVGSSRPSVSVRPIPTTAVSSRPAVSTVRPIPTTAASTVRPIPTTAMSSRPAVSTVRPIPTTAASTVRPIPTTAVSSRPAVSTVRPIPTTAASTVRPIPTTAVSSRPAVSTVRPTPTTAASTVRPIPTMTVSSRPAVSTVRPIPTMTRPVTVAAQPAQPTARPQVVSRPQQGPKASAQTFQHPGSTAQASGYGRGKPSHPATLSARQQTDDSSDDCIILSSGQDSESD